MQYNAAITDYNTAFYLDQDYLNRGNAKYELGLCFSLPSTTMIPLWIQTRL